MRLFRIAFVIGIVSAGTIRGGPRLLPPVVPRRPSRQPSTRLRTGDTVIIPNGSCTWTSGVAITGKGIILLGASTAGVVITNNVGGNAINVKEDGSVHSQVGRMTINGNSSSVAIVVDPHDSPSDTGGRSVLIHDLVFSNSNAIRMNTNRGVIYSITANNHGGTEEVVQCKPQGLLSSWNTPSTMGTADVSGESNVYVEDSTFTLALHEAIDWDDNCRLVIRHNTFDNSSITSHGADTSSIGARHVEIYNNTFIFTNFGDCDGSKTANLAYWIFMRGATGIIADNTGLTNMSSCAWGNKPALNLTVMNLQRNAGPNPCWGQGTSNGARYHVPRQVGMGYVHRSRNRWKRPQKKRFDDVCRRPGADVHLEPDLYTDHLRLREHSVRFVFGRTERLRQEQQLPGGRARLLHGHCEAGIYEIFLSASDSRRWCRGADGADEPARRRVAR